MTWVHEPVLVKEVLDFIGISGGKFADLTFGEGGHTGALLRHGASEVWSVDRDPSAIALYQEKGEFRADPRLHLLHGCYSSFPDSVPDAAGTFDGILLDLGVSTRQLLEAGRGFSIKEPGPLDMRMNQSEGETLMDLLQRLDQDELANVLYRNADLHESRSMARKIRRALDAGTLQTTSDLAALFPGPAHRPSPATPVFMALRMEVNRELDEIESTIPRLLPLLKVGGKLGVITFHSTEDRLVKHIFLRLAGRCICRKSPCFCPTEQTVNILTKKPVIASETELEINPRARSAKLRCIERIGIPR